MDNQQDVTPTPQAAQTNSAEAPQAPATAQPYAPQDPAYQNGYAQQGEAYQNGYQQQPPAYQVGYQQAGAYQYQQPPQYGAPVMAPGTAPMQDNSTTYIVLSVLEIIFCGLLGIVPLIYSIAYKDALAAGNYPLAMQKQKVAKGWLIGLLIAVAVVIVITIAIIAFFSAATYSSGYSASYSSSLVA